MKVASGDVKDRPFARTVFSLASKRFTGDLVLHHKRRDTTVVWAGGQIVAAKSASPADTLGRQALTHGLVTSSTLGTFVQKLAEDPGQDEAALLAELGRLSSDQVRTLKHHVLVRSAARIFALPEATFVVDNQPSITADPELPALDVRWLVYFGLRTHYSLERLGAELAALGHRRISLSPEAVPALPAFGFGEYEHHVLARLQAEPISLVDLKATGLDAHITSCVVYALVACSYLKYDAAVSSPHAEGSPSTVQGVGFVEPSDAPEAGRSGGSSLAPGTVQGVGFVEPQIATEPNRASAPAVRSAPAAERAPVAKRTPKAKSAPAAKRTPKAKANGADAETTVALVKEKIRILDSGGTHYEVLGQQADATSADVRKAYFQLARRLHPDRLQSLGIEGLADEIQRAFAAINEAFKVLSNPKELEQYKKVLAAGGKAAYDAEQAKAEKLASQIFEAEEHFHLGEMALRRDQYATAEREFAKACELQPDESEYQALHVWAMYCNSSDRPSVESEAIGKMSSAILRSPNSVTTRKYHAKLLKLMGRTDEAIASFKKLVEMSPQDRDAKLELRVLEEQQSSAPADAKSSKKKGFFGR